MPLVKLILATVLFTLGLCYLYKPSWVVRMNAWCREFLFDDARILLARRKIGLLNILLSVLFFYSGFERLAIAPKAGSRIEQQIFPEAQQAFQAKRYYGAVARCQQLIRRYPTHKDAWQLLGASWLAMGKTAEAKAAWERVVQLDPNHPIRRSRLFMELESIQEKKAP